MRSTAGASECCVRPPSITLLAGYLAFGSFVSFEVVRIWIKNIRDSLRDRRARRPLNLIKKISESEYETLNLDHVRSKIIDAEEFLHYSDIWRRMLTVWASFGNLLILGVVTVGYFVKVRWIIEYGSVVVFVLIASILVSPILAFLRYRRTRKIKVIIRKLHVVLRRIKSDDVARVTSSSDDSELILAEQRRYRDELPEVVAQYREEANRYRRVHNRFQSVIIIGSVLTSAITTASVSFNQVRWGAVVMSAIVGLAAGFTGYFKYRERSFNLQQTADAIEREVESVELRVGKYRGMTTHQAYMAFASVVESLRDEQNKRQQQLDQPVEVKQGGVGE